MRIIIYLLAPHAAGASVTIEGVGVMDVARITASIEAVDVKNLAQVKAGDKLELGYYESVAIAVKSAEGVPSRTDSVLVGKAAPREKPGAHALRKVSVV